MNIEQSKKLTRSQEILELKDRVRAIINHLGPGWVSDMCKMFPDYNSQKGRRMLTNAKAMMVMNAKAVADMEAYVQAHNKMIATAKQIRK